jgi:peptide/nickel transport system substrate-binding protein
MDSGRDRRKIHSIWRKSVMKRKIFILAMALTFMAAFTFAAGQQGSAAATQDSKYGGTLTIANTGTYSDPGSPAQADAQVGALANWTATVQEHLILGDHEKWGKMGNGEFPFEVSDYIPDKYVRGMLLEGWDVTPERAELYVRKGIMWYADHVDWMETRELVAEDIAFDINAFWDNKAWGTRFDGVLSKHAYAKDRYTVVCEFETFNNQFLYYIGWEDRANYSPPELEKNNPKIWTNHVGTGPYWIKSYTPGVSMIFEKNPIYWDTCVIDGETYKKPFVDQLVVPILPDEATRLSAFRTGKVDWTSGPPATTWEDYDKIGPGVKMDAFNVGNGKTVWLNNKEGYFADRNVRRALHVGTNPSPIAQLLKSEDLPARYWPQSPSNPDAFITDAKLPASTALLFKYDPAKAKQMLADAGYPNGFKVEMLVSYEPPNPDVAAILQEQWAKIGIQTTINIKERAAFDRDAYSVEYEAIAIPDGFDAANPIAVLSSECQTDAYYNTSGYSNPEADRIIVALLQENDPARQFELIKQASLIVLDDAMTIQLTPRAYRTYWWDWVENYFGEFSLSDGNFTELTPWMWINQDRKKALGF